MSHGLSGLAGEARCDQLVVAPDRTIKEHQRGAGKACLEIVGHLGAGGDDEEIFAGGLVADAKAEGVAGTAAAAGMRLAFEIPSALAGNGEGQDLDAAR